MANGELLERRMLLRGAGVAGATLAAVAATPAVASAHGDGGGGSGSGRLLGAWVITHADDAPGDTTKVTAVAGFAVGGVFTVQDIAPASTAGLGAWKSHDEWFKVTFWTGQNGDTPTAHGTTVQVRIRGKVHKDKISGTYAFSVYDAVTGAVVASGTGKFSGDRLEA